MSFFFSPESLVSWKLSDGIGLFLCGKELWEPVTPQILLWLTLGDTHTFVDTRYEYIYKHLS